MYTKIIVKEIADSAFKLGIAWASGNILRTCNKYRFKKCPYILPDYVIGMNFESHLFLEKLAKHAFRAGYKQGLKNLTKEL